VLTFAATISNENTRAAYYRASWHFFAWLEQHGIDELVGAPDQRSSRSRLPDPRPQATPDQVLGKDNGAIEKRILASARM
jgi:hypothetical protein